MFYRYIVKLTSYALIFQVGNFFITGHKEATNKKCNQIKEDGVAHNRIKRVSFIKTPKQ